MEMKKSLGYFPDKASYREAMADLDHYIRLKLMSMGYSIARANPDSQFIETANSFFKNYQEKNRLLSEYLCPADHRIQTFLDDYLKDAKLKDRPKLPVHAFTLDQHGLARILSIPHDRDLFESEYISSFRIQQGVLHNPRSDRRTTEGSFHIAEGGLRIPDDKRSVPKSVFGQLLLRALTPPRELLRLPYAAYEEKPFETFVSLLLRPQVSPEVPGFISKKSMEIRFFAPGSLVSNLDFVESIFGNAGDPYLPENDAGLDTEHWTGHSGCVILAPHLTKVTKEEIGLPHWDDASERQRRDGMCWKDPKEFYNGGTSFKLTSRDQRGMMVTIIADNYFGYCKKEVKTQISFSANLFGLCEEEHSGGAVAFQRYDLGDKFALDQLPRKFPHTFEEMKKLFAADFMDVRPEGYAVDRNHPEICYIPQDAVVDLNAQKIIWTTNGKAQQIKLLPTQVYVYPCGYKINMEKKFGGRYWRLIGTVAEGTLCHKPSTVSGGGKSEISKPIANAIITGPVFTADFDKDLDSVDQILNRDFMDRFRVKPGPQYNKSRPILAPQRSLGSVIKLFTQDPIFTDEYNTWLKSIPSHVKELVFFVKRFYKASWGKDWKSHFSVDIINGLPGYELKYEGTPLVANYLRVGLESDGSWRLYQLRPDFNSAAKLQVEDDITVSVTVPTRSVPYLNLTGRPGSLKFVENCEYRLFQRPDDAIHRGFDKETEEHFTHPDNFVSNYEPLTRDQAKAMIEDAARFDQYTDPMKHMIRNFVEKGKCDFVVSTAHPRMVDGKPSKNPRFLQNRPDLVAPSKTYLALVGSRFYYKIPSDRPVLFPVDAVLAGRRNNPPETGVRALCVYNPIHYQELPELFMDFICSLTGRSPSTTGAGSEGALTKGPFNAILPTADLNNALVGYILNAHSGFSSAAGYVGPDVQVDHDVSLLIPEIWCRMQPGERSPEYLIREGYLEKIQDFKHKDELILASRLGYRITSKFVNAYLGRVFNHPSSVFSDAMLRPEIQNLETFVDGVKNIVEAQQRVAQAYFRDGSIELACPPLQALLHIMAHGQFEGKGVDHPDIRALFTRESLLKSEWYLERLRIRQASEANLLRRHIQYLEQFLANPSYGHEAERLGISERLRQTRATLEETRGPAYLERLKETLGADPVYMQRLTTLAVSRGSELSV